MNQRALELAWKTIDNWFRLNAPKAGSPLADGVTSTAILTAETAIGCKFPADLRVSYQLHNGSNDCWIFTWGGSWLPLSGAQQRWNAFSVSLSEGDFKGR